MSDLGALQWKTQKGKMPDPEKLSIEVCEFFNRE